MQKLQQSTTIKQSSQFSDKKSESISTNDSSFNSIQVCSFRTHLLETEDESIKKHLNFSCACFAFKEGVQMHQCQSDHSDVTGLLPKPKLTLSMLNNTSNRPNICVSVCFQCFKIKTTPLRHTFTIFNQSNGIVVHLSYQCTDVSFDPMECLFHLRDEFMFACRSRVQTTANERNKHREKLTLSFDALLPLHFRRNWQRGALIAWGQLRRLPNAPQETIKFEYDTFTHTNNGYLTNEQHQQQPDRHLNTENRDNFLPTIVYHNPSAVSRQHQRPPVTYNNHYSYCFQDYNNYPAQSYYSSGSQTVIDRGRRPRNMLRISPNSAFSPIRNESKYNDWAVHAGHPLIEPIAIKPVPVHMDAVHVHPAHRTYHTEKWKEPKHLKPPLSEMFIPPRATMTTLVTGSPRQPAYGKTQFDWPSSFDQTLDYPDDGYQQTLRPTYRRQGTVPDSWSSGHSQLAALSVGGQQRSRTWTKQTSSFCDPDAETVHFRRRQQQFTYQPPVKPCLFSGSLNRRADNDSSTLSSWHHSGPRQQQHQQLKQQWMLCDEPATRQTVLPVPYDEPFTEHRQRRLERRVTVGGSGSKDFSTCRPTLSTEPPIGVRIQPRDSIALAKKDFKLQNGKSPKMRVKSKHVSFSLLDKEEDHDRRVPVEADEFKVAPVQRNGNVDSNVFFHNAIESLRGGNVTAKTKLFEALADSAQRSAVRYDPARSPTTDQSCKENNRQYNSNNGRRASECRLTSATRHFEPDDLMGVDQHWDNVEPLQSYPLVHYHSTPNVQVDQTPLVPLSRYPSVGSTLAGGTAPTRVAESNAEAYEDEFSKLSLLQKARLFDTTTATKAVQKRRDDTRSITQPVTEEDLKSARSFVHSFIGSKLTGSVVNLTPNVNYSHHNASAMEKRFTSNTLVDENAPTVVNTKRETLSSSTSPSQPSEPVTRRIMKPRRVVYLHTEEEAEAMSKRSEVSSSDADYDSSFLKDWDLKNALHSKETPL
ncbi:hypothetical protein T4C_3713 [Trichinella pseudospiralis]|uniref:Uncharacterized protein n=1 Tax=Trichinella pseudospiralis TaxID=6337 RepID=A0A0V1JTH4_TRIPS|nr:hypothetical protein T4C_3713 [Trichinella pseudospiralis]